MPALAGNLIRAGQLVFGHRLVPLKWLAIAATGWPTVRLRLAYLGLTNTFGLLRLLPRSDRDKDLEILALRHPTRSAATPTRGHEVSVLASRPGTACRAPAPTTASCVAQEHRRRAGIDLDHYGDEEFAVLLPGITTDEQAAAVAERIRVSISLLSITTQVRDRRTQTICGLTASIGAAAYPTHATNGHGLLLAADYTPVPRQNTGRTESKSRSRPSHH